MSWSLEIPLDRDAALSLSAQLADALSRAIRTERLPSGYRLPGTRSLARTLGVSRNTVLAAYDELAAQGWLRMVPGSGAFVSRDIPARTHVGEVGDWSKVGFDVDATPAPLGRPSASDGLRRWDFGVPDARIAPLAELGRAYRRALSPVTASYRFPGHGDPKRLEGQLAAMLSITRGRTVTEANVMVTRGSQMGLYLIARLLLRPGDVVAVEEPGYASAWEQVRLAGGTVVPLAVDDEGLSIEALRRVLDRHALRAVFITPHHQFPTTVTMSVARRVELLQLARAHRIAIIEDDCDHEFHYDGRPVPPLMGSDTAGTVLYVGSLSKIFAPGLRLGYVVAPTPIIRHLGGLRYLTDIEGDKPLEHAMAELFEDGTIERHENRSRRVYRRRRDALAEMLRCELGDVLDFDVPAGGMAIWARVVGGVDVEAWAERSRRRGLLFRTGRAFYLDGGKRPFVRLGFAQLDENELHEMVTLMRRSLDRG